MLTKEEFLSFYPGLPGASSCFDAISKALAGEGIYSDLVLIGALATVRVEVGRAFFPIAEYASGQAYDITVNPKLAAELGNTTPGDGVKYKGRGFIQLTGKFNYTSYGKNLGVDLVDSPTLALDPLIAAEVLASYFKSKGCDVACNAKNWAKVRQLVNGGNGVDSQDGGTTNGLNLFLSVVAQYLKVDIIK